MTKGYLVLETRELFERDTSYIFNQFVQQVKTAGGSKYVQA